MLSKLASPKNDGALLRVIAKNLEMIYYQCLAKKVKRWHPFCLY